MGWGRTPAKLLGFSEITPDSLQPDCPPHLLFWLKLNLITAEHDNMFLIRAML